MERGGEGRRGLTEFHNRRDDRRQERSPGELTDRGLGVGEGEGGFTGQEGGGEYSVTIRVLAVWEK